MNEDKEKVETTERKTNGLKEFFLKLKQVKNIHLYLGVIIAAIAVLIYFSGSFGDTASSSSNTQANAYDYCVQTEQKLKEVLSKIKGAGKVDVMINFESSQEIVIAYINTTTTNSSTQGNGSAGQTNSSTSQTTNPQILQSQGSQIPLILKTVNPKVKGVIVVAEGAGNTKTKLDLITAVSTVLEINGNLVNVFVMK